MTVTEKLGEYKELMAIKRGQFGIVHKVEHIATKRVYARKTVRYGSRDQRAVQLLMQEANLLRRLHHVNVLGYHDVIIDEKAKVIYIFTEFCSKGDLYQLIDKHRYPRQNIPEDRLWKIFGQLLLALEYCHSPTKPDFELGEVVIHRDIKPANILVADEDVIKLADFGFSRTFNSSDMLNTQLGTPNYTAPEILSKQPYNEKADIWSLGCVMFHLCSLEFPFMAMNQVELTQNVKNGKRREFPRDVYSKEMEQLVDSMMQLDYRARPSAAELVRHPKFIEHGVITAEYLANDPSKRLGEKDRMIAELKMCLKMKQQEVDNLEDDLSNNREVLDAMAITRAGASPGGGEVVETRSNAEKELQDLRKEYGLAIERLKKLEADNQDLRSQNTQLSSKVIKLEEKLKTLTLAQANVSLDGMTPLMKAVQVQDIEGVKAQITKDAGKKNRKGKTALMLCADSGFVEGAKLLEPYEAGIKMSDGTTALILAAIAGRVEIVRLLKKREGRIQAKQGDTALINAAVTGNTAVVKELIDIEAGLRMTDGRAAIHNAAYKGHLEIVKLLMPYEHSLTDNSGLTPLKYASKGKQTAIVNFINGWTQSQ
ncbi:Kinase, NEK [Giardia muris]|uniref:non-specific serine/threonine protein kinase n=1 Tax=Giardia muris TaxID=5742 RepID=A0A4Z1SLW5_GIAMU|nr:Kinase, NEK [Giardia muris]|eukprot:TNJ26662.1 Kinase, NEK [Giardia muris]